MISGSRSRSGVPLDEQSAVPTAPGVPWWGAVLLAVGLTSVGAVIVVAGDDTELGLSFKTFYVAGCVAAVLAVRRRALFTAVAQPPLVLFGVAVITLYFLVSGTDSGLKKLLFNVALPVAKLFPLMGWTFLIVLAIAAARIWLTHPKNAGKAVETGDRKTSASPKKAATKSSPRTADKARPSAGNKARTGTSKPARPQPRTVVDNEAPAPTAVAMPRNVQTPRPPVRTTDPRPRAAEPRATERGDDLAVPPRRRRAAPDVPPESRPRRAATYDDQPPPPGARAYRAPNDFIYAPPPRMRDRDLH